MLTGFLVVAAAQLALVTVPVWLVLSMVSDSAAFRLGVPLCIATVGVMASATWRALRSRRTFPVGIPVGRDDAPGLWSLIDAAAAAAGVRPPDGVTVVADAGAGLIERARLFGLIGGRRDLYIGLPLLQAWDTEQLRAVVAHELAHGSPALSRWAPRTYRGRVAVGRAVPRIARNNPAGPLLRAWAELYRRVDAPFSRAQELQADRIAAGFAGVGATAAVLRDKPALEAMLRVFHTEYVAPGRRAGHMPDDIFGGFLRMLAARADEMAVLRTRELPDPARWDTHPPRAERLAALTAASAASSTAAAAATHDAPSRGDAPSGRGAASSHDAPSGELVPDLPGLGRALQTVAFPAQGRTTVGWDAFFGAARTAEMEREAEGALGAISRAAGIPVSSAADVLDLAADGRLRKAAEDIFPDLPPDETARRIGELVTLLLALAALRSGVARWRHSWTGTAELVRSDGGHLDLGGLAALAGDPATVAAARQRLTDLGVDLAGTGVDPAAPAAGSARAEVVSGLVNLVVDGARTDLLIVDTGLFLVPGLPRSQNGSAKRRLAQFAAADAAQRELTAPGGRFVPYTDLAGAARTRRTPKSWDFSLRKGGTLTVRTAIDSDELPGGWAALDDAVTFVAHTATKLAAPQTAGDTQPAGR
jgi:Zn-dependent protease with chaperone function